MSEPGHDSVEHPPPEAAPDAAPGSAPGSAPAAAPGSGVPGVLSDPIQPPPAGGVTPQKMVSPEGGAIGIVKRLGPASILALAWAFLPAVLGFMLLANMQPAADYIADWSTPQRVGAYMTMFALSAGLGLLPTYAQALFGGYLFRSLVLGVPAALGGFLGASAIGYVLAKRVAGEHVEKELGRHPKAQIVRTALVGRGFWRTLGVVSLIRLPPNSPFALTNLLLASSGVPLGVYLLGTLIGMTPRTAIVVWLGTQVQTWGEQEKPMWYLIAMIVSTVVVLMVLSKIANQAIDRSMRRFDKAVVGGK